MPSDNATNREQSTYRYTDRPLVSVYESREGNKKVATLFLGEWLKLLEDDVPPNGRALVRYRGGRGYVRTADLREDRLLEVFFIDVDQGDSILVQTPDDRRILIDGGQNGEAHRFIRDKYNLYQKGNYIDFEAVVATHMDSDHAKGLIPILADPKIAVKRFYHNGIFRRSSNETAQVKNGRITGLTDCPTAQDLPNLTPLMQELLGALEVARSNLPVAVAGMNKSARWQGSVRMPRQGMVCKRLDLADQYLPPFDARGDLRVEVLWPAASTAGGKLSYRHFGDMGKTVNGNSVVLMLRYGASRILLTGDLNEPSMGEMLAYYHRRGEVDRLRADVYKAAHHGSQDFSVPFLQAVAPDAAVVSSGDDRRDAHGHPRAVLLGTITRYSNSRRPAVFCTELACCFSPITVKKAVRDEYLAGTEQLYEKSIQGIVHLRSDGERMVLGTVHGRRPPKAKMANQTWKWDVWPDDV